MTTPYVSIYARIVSRAVELLMEHRQWTADKAIARAVEYKHLWKAYYSTLKPSERVEMELLVKARRNAEREAQR